MTSIYNKIEFDDYVNLFFHCMADSNNIEHLLLTPPTTVDINTDSELLRIFLTSKSILLYKSYSVNIHCDAHAQIIIAKIAKIANI